MNLEEIIQLLVDAYNNQRTIRIGSVGLNDSERKLLIDKLQKPENEMKVTHSFDISNLQQLAKEIKVLKDEPNTTKKSKPSSRK
jgi:hypothetical protein